NCRGCAGAWWGRCSRASTAPLVESFGRSAFHADLRLVRPTGVATLGLGSALMLVLGSTYPAWRAMRLDPLDVLERR
ncbi:MAG TPA: hypothetical protein PKY27_10925, partial [Arachnia sp.]|nr:hypothetical protein [Arachnia sp.]